MADPAPTTDIGALTPDLAPTTSSAIGDLTKLKKQQVAEETNVINLADKRLEADQERVEKAFKAEGYEPDQLKPWDADKEHRKFESNPIEGIGSVGSIFAVIASAFTKAPATNAMLGMAGAINSIKAGDEASYQRAYDSYKENMKLALERHKIEHEQYQDAVNLMSTNMAAGQAKMHNLAVKFNDQQTLMLLEHGMSKELFEMMAARNKASESMLDLNEKVTKATFQKLAVDQLKQNPPNTGDPVQDKLMMAAQVQRIYDGDGKYGTAEQEAVGRYVMTHRNDPPDKFADGLADIHQQFSAKAPNIEGYQQAKQAWADQHPGETIPAEEDAKLLQQFGLTGTGRGGAGGGAGSQSTQARKTQAIREIQQKHEEKGEKISLADAEREYNQTVQIPSAHDKFMAEGQYQKAERMETAMDEMDELLLKHKFITGLGGTLTRPVEALGNILGSNETDRKQFQRIATELKEWGQAVVNDRSGRPLSSEARDAAVIFAGLNPGDTGPNTVRAIAELRPVIKRIKEQLRARGTGQGPFSGSEAPVAPTSQPSGSTDWLNAYPTPGGGKQSSASEAPPVNGARKAPDGNWYISDPKRPGKYLQVQVG
jgi:hypothetical protein